MNDRPDDKVQQDQTNTGKPGIDTDGDLTIGIGNGLTIDATDGSLGMEIAPGISIDFDGD